MKPRFAFLFIFLCGLAGSVTSTWLEHRAVASRNSAGTYSLPSSYNPVVTGTTITSTWANNTLNDLSSEMTDSLDRSGKGGMLQPLGLNFGTVSTPGLYFTGESNSGLYRSGLQDLRMSIGGTDLQKWNLTSSTFVQNVGFGGRTPVKFYIESPDAAAGDTFAQLGTTQPIYLRNNSLSFNNYNNGVSTVNGVNGFAGAVRLNTSSGAVEVLSSASGTAGSAVSTPTVNLAVSNSGVVIGSGGTNISATFGANPTGTLTWSPSSTPSGASSSSSSSVTGASASSVATCSVPNGVSACFDVACSVLSTNTVTYRAFNFCGSTQTPPAVMNIRVWNF